VAVDLTLGGNLSSTSAGKYIAFAHGNGDYFYLYGNAKNFAIAAGSTSTGGNRCVCIVDRPNVASDYSNTIQTNPTLYVYSATAAATATDQWLSFAHDQTNGVISTGKGTLSLTPFAGTVSIGTATTAGAISVAETKGATFGIQSQTEELTIAVGAGSGGVATTMTVPSGTMLISASFYVTQAPGGGAATFTAGVTGGAADGLANGCATTLAAAVTSWANTTGGTLTAPLVVRTASTITVTTNANVTVSDMKVRVVISYLTQGTPTA
jgi:hypothetical protein